MNFMLHLHLVTFSRIFNILLGIIEISKLTLCISGNLAQNLGMEFSLKIILRNYSKKKSQTRRTLKNLFLPSL